MDNGNNNISIILVYQFIKKEKGHSWVETGY